MSKNTRRNIASTNRPQQHRRFQSNSAHAFTQPRNRPQELYSTQQSLGPWLVIRGMMIMCLALTITCLALFNSSASSINDHDWQTDREDALSIPSAWDDLPCRLNNLLPGDILQWCALITFYAEKNNLPPDLVGALVWFESGGNPSAYSRSGAVGLMQVMPRDGLAANFQCINGPCFAARPTIAELQDPVFNIEYGTRMLAGLYQRRQSLREALKSYGPMDVGYSYADKVLSLYERYRVH